MPRRMLILWGLAAIVAGYCAAASQAAPPERSLPSKEEALQTIDWFARAATAGDWATADAQIDWDTILDKAMADVEASDRFRNSYRLGLKRTLAGELGFVRKTGRLLEAGGTIRLLRIQQQDGQTRALLRIWPTRQSIVYEELLLARSNGVIRIVDVYRLASGELMSESLRRGYLLAAVGQSRQAGNKKESELLTHLATISEMSDKFRRQKFAEALAAYRKLPESLQRDKNLLLLRLSAAQQLGGNEYAAAVEAFRAAFPNDGALNFVLLEYALRNRLLSEGLNCVQRIDAAVGGDPGLACTRAQLLLAAGKLAEARQQAAQAMAHEPRQAGAYWMLIEISAAQGNFAETAQLLQTLESELHVAPPELSKVPALEAFVRSPEYAAWRAPQKGK